MSESPERERLSPPSTTSQKISFCPALNFFEGGWTPFMKMPPPFANQMRSYLLGMLWRTQMMNINATPSMKGKAI